MPDDGHPIAFGAFITPAHSARPGADHGPTALAVRAEDFGLDLVTFQDHPDHPSFYDAWTLLTWVAARTEQLRAVRPRYPPTGLFRDNFYISPE